MLGLSLDFVYLNLWGFLCYTIFNLAFYLSPLIQKQFQDSYGQSGEGLVEANDGKLLVVI